MIRFDTDGKQIGAMELKPLAEHTPRTPDVNHKAHDETLIAVVAAFLKTGKLPDGSPANQNWLAKQIGLTSAVVSSWLSGTYKGDVTRVERAIADVMKASSSRLNVKHALFETPVTMEIHAACERIKRRNRIALVSGPAGEGKTSGIILYKMANPTCVVVTAIKGEGNEIAMQRGLMRQIDTRRFSTKRGDSRLSYLIEHFKGSNRLIIVDNAHRMTRGGLQFMFDFHDETACPICLVGNPEVLEKISDNDQMFSRISLHIEVKFHDPRSRTALQILGSMCPDHSEALLPLATQVITQRGHVRALRYQIEEALDLFDSGKFKSIEQAFRAAHTQLVRDYPLAA